MREDFEKWYKSKFLRIMTGTEAVVVNLRNDFGGYDDHHMDGAWECWALISDLREANNLIYADLVRVKDLLKKCGNSLHEADRKSYDLIFL